MAATLPMHRGKHQNSWHQADNQYGDRYSQACHTERFFGKRYFEMLLVVAPNDSEPNDDRN